MATSRWREATVTLPSGLRTHSMRGDQRASMNSAMGHRVVVARRGFRSAVRDEHSATGTPGARPSSYASAIGRRRLGAVVTRERFRCAASNA